jgi:hypothetical protein
VLVNKPDHRIKGLGEVSIRVRDLAAMCAFLRTSSGSRCSGREESFVFFEIAERYGGHSQNLALFDSSERTLLEWRSRPLSSDQSTLASHRLERQRLATGSACFSCSTLASVVAS